MSGSGKSTSYAEPAAPTRVGTTRTAVIIEHERSVSTVTVGSRWIGGGPALHKLIVAFHRATRQLE
jgi:hypothetical protein